MTEWLMTLNDQIGEQQGDGGVDAILSILRAGADAAPGADVAQIERVLSEASTRAEQPMADSEIHGMAWNLAVPDLTLVRVVNGSNRTIAEIPVANDPSRLSRSERSDNEHVEPENPDRPTYS